MLCTLYLYFLSQEIPAELLDRQDVLSDKVLYLATLLRLSRRTVVYTGAGVSTSCGVRQRAQGSSSGTGRSQTTNARPSLTHLLISELVKVGLVHTWVTLCCDGLAQKAGCPQQKVVEVHGSWYDPSNPVLRQGGVVRSDIRERLSDLQVRTQSGWMIRDSRDSMELTRF